MGSVNGNVQHIPKDIPPTESNSFATLYKGEKELQYAVAAP